MMTPEPKTIDEYRDALETLNRDEMLVGLRLQVAEIQARRLKIEALTAERDALKDAARLALDVLGNIPQADSDCDEKTQQDDDAMQEAIAALRAVL